MKDLERMNFLIVEDTDSMRRSIRTMLQLMGYGREYFEAINGKEAWNLLDSGEVEVDFIISDYKMPIMTGTELLHQIRSNKKWRYTPFLMVTADANMEVVAEAAEHDVDAYITKPFVTASLEQKIIELRRQALNPGPFDLHLRKAKDLEEAGNIDGAIEHAQRALAVNSQSSRPYRELGRLYLIKGDLKNSLSHFRQATELNRLDVVSYHYLGQIKHRLGDIKGAMEDFGKAMEISPRHSDRAYNFGKLLLRQKQFNEARKIFKMLVRNTDQFDFKEEIADTCNEYGLYDVAVKAYKELLAEDPSRYYLAKKLGIAYQRNGNNPKAVQVLEEAVERFGEDVDSLLGLAKAYLEMNMLVRADKWAVMVIRLDPDNEEAKDIMDKCV